MTDIDISTLAESLDRGERAALLALPMPDRGYLDDETWMMFYSLLSRGLLCGGSDNIMRRTELGEAVVRQIQPDVADRDG